MKKALPIIIAVIAIVAVVLCIVLFAGGTEDDIKKDNSTKYIGVWKDADKNQFMYIYEDGTGDYYRPGEYHFNSFTWKIEEGYFVRYATNAFGGEVITKYTLENNSLLNSQKKIAFNKYSYDTTIDVK